MPILFLGVLKNVLAVYSKEKIIITSLAALATLLVIVVPLHEFMHLLVMSKGKLDDKCVLTAGGGAVSAAYEGHISRTCRLLCFVTPCLVFALIFTLAIIFTDSIVRLYFIYMLVMSCLTSYADIFMIFYTIKHVRKNEMIFGAYKKEF